jgi:hypothetical protein
MILKEKEIISSDNHKVNAGIQAEKQMAFYLSRNFAKDTNCFVINDLRVVFDGDVAQIDHLIVTQYGLFIVESKSVHSQISINKNAEWSRSYQNKKTGMPSPVLQAEAQAKILKSLLNENKQVLLSKLFGALQKGFGFCPINIYVAISDTGIINREINIPELFKADQVCNSIKEKIKQSKKVSSLLSLSMDTGWVMSDSEARIVADFLVSQHQPLTKNTQHKVEDSSAPIALPKNKTPLSFIPKEGENCPVCKEFKLVKKSIQRPSGKITVKTHPI